MTKEFDIRGQVCPSALLVTLREVNTMYGALQNGEQALHVLTDSRKATETIPGAMSNMGLDVEVSPQDGYYRVIIGRSE